MIERLGKLIHWIGFIIFVSFSIIAFIGDIPNPLIPIGIGFFGFQVPAWAIKWVLTSDNSFFPWNNI